MNKGVWLAIAMVAFAIPASAQKWNDDDVPSGGLARNGAECVAQFQAADLNGDGFLNWREMNESRSLMPTELSNQERITRSEFLSVCNSLSESHSPG